MAKVSTLNATGSIVGDAMNETFGVSPNVILMTNANAPGGVPTNVTLASGVNTFAVPALSQVLGGWILIQCPAGSSNAKILKGASGDTGIPFSQGFVVLPGGPTLTSFVINSTSSGEVLQVYYG